MNFTDARARMVRDQLRARGIHDPRVLAVMQRLPRERFVPAELRANAYDDSPLHIGAEQTISQPYVVALMTQALHLGGAEKVLEIGTGSGYQAAILAALAAQVYSVERYHLLAETAQCVLAELEIDNVEIGVGDGSLGWRDRAPFEAIIVTAAAPVMPPILLDQLTAQGRIVIPIGSHWEQDLQVWERQGADWRVTNLCPVRFVPLIGEGGW